MMVCGPPQPPRWYMPPCLVIKLFEFLELSEYMDLIEDWDRDVTETYAWALFIE